MRLFAKSSRYESTIFMRMKITMFSNSEGYSWSSWWMIDVRSLRVQSILSITMQNRFLTPLYYFMSTYPESSTLITLFWSLSFMKLTYFKPYFPDLSIYTVENSSSCGDKTFTAALIWVFYLWCPLYTCP